MRENQRSHASGNSGPGKHGQKRYAKHNLRNHHRNVQQRIDQLLPAELIAVHADGTERADRGREQGTYHCKKYRIAEGIQERRVPEQFPVPIQGKTFPGQIWLRHCPIKRVDHNNHYRKK